MTDRRNKPRSSFLPYLILVTLCLGLGFAGMMLRRRAEDQLGRLETSKRQYREMIDMQKWARTQTGPPLPEFTELKSEWEGYLEYLPKVQREIGIKPVHMQRFDPQGRRPLPQGEWDAYGIRIPLRGTRQDPLKLALVTEFLHRVETERNFLKTTRLTLTLEEGKNIRGASEVTLSYWLKTPPKAD